jgi:hypothetical protein
MQQQLPIKFARVRQLEKKKKEKKNALSESLVGPSNLPLDLRCVADICTDTLLTEFGLTTSHFWFFTADSYMYSRGQIEIAPPFSVRASNIKILRFWWGGGGGFSRKVWLIVGVATISYTRPKDFGMVEALTDHYRKRQSNFNLAA